MLVLEILSVVFGTGITSAFLPSIARKLSRLYRKLKSRGSKISEKVKQLERQLLKIQAHVNDAENQASISSAYLILIEDFKNILLDGDDLLDKSLLEYDRIYSQHSKASSLDTHLKKFEVKLGKEIDEMLSKVNHLALEMQGYVISELSQQKLAQTFPAPPQNVRGSLIDECSVVGRKRDKQQILKLLQTQNNNNVSVISIVGMVGIGKTTVAQLVFNDQNVVDEFTANRMWWVSLSFGDDVMKITKHICESAAKIKSDSAVAQLSNLDSLQLILKNIVGDTEKFLLVLDGLTDENSMTWDTILLPFMSAASGSRIIVTTRSQIVASIVSDHSGTYSLDLLSDKNCFEIINRGLTLSLSQQNGLTIAKECKGIPLVAKLIQTAIRLRTKDEELEDIPKYELWNLARDTNMIYPVLKSGYDQLPAHLKRCFAYTSLLPRNSPFQRDDLIELWAAEGFIEAEGTRRIEDIGKDYFFELFSRSFFQLSYKKPGKEMYQMHDFVHELAKIVSRNFCFASEATHPFPVSTNVRHSSVFDENLEPSALEKFYGYEKLRTFMLLSKTSKKLTTVPDDFFQSFPRLRVLNISGTAITELSAEIKRLRHLRYLNVSHTYIRRFPGEIDQLLGLERLKAKGCKQLKELPVNLNRMIKMQHIELDKDTEVRSMPIDVGKLINLETLTVFVVGTEQGTTIGELKEMAFLRGSLRISKLEKVKNGNEAKAAKLHEKKYLDELELQWEPKRLGTDDIAVLEALKPHTSLSKLQVVGYGSPVFPGWISDPAFSKLLTVNISNCRSSVLPSLGELPLLKHLEIAKMRILENIEHHFFRSDVRSSQVSFPCLETLLFHEMPALKTWDGLRDDDMPRLIKLTIYACKGLCSIPNLSKLPSLTELEVSLCPQLHSFKGDALPNSMKSLIVRDCGLLKKQYCAIHAPSWHTISHIYYIETEDGILQSL